MNKKIIVLLIFFFFLYSNFGNASRMILSTKTEKQIRLIEDSTIASSVYFDDPFEDWNKTYGRYGYGCSIQQVNGNGYIITGMASQDIFLKRIDNEGNEIWNKEFGGNGLDMGFCVQQTIDNGFIIFGTTGSFGAGETDVWLIKTDTNGNMQWNKTFGGANLDQGNSGQQTNDGGYVIIGITKSFVSEKNDYWIIKTDVDGNEIWNVTVGGIGWDVGLDIQQTNDGGFILTGIKDVSPTGSHQVDVGLEKIDSNGNLEWEKTFGSVSRRQDQGFSVKQATDGGYIVTGVIDADSDSVENGDLWIIKTDNKGNKQWDKIYAGSNSDVGKSVYQTSDGGYIVLGMTDSYGAGKYDLILLRLDANGNQIWEKTFGGEKDDTIFFGPKSIIQTSDNGFIVIGSTESYKHSPTIGPAIWVIKIKAFENQRPNKPTSRYDENVKELIVTATDPDGNKIKYGVSWNNNENIDYWTDFYDSGEEVNINCKNRLGLVGIIAKDEYGGISEMISAKSLIKVNSFILIVAKYLFRNVKELFEIGFC
jgi:hypothetical protein